MNAARDARLAFETEQRHRYAAEDELKRRAKADAARFAELATEQAMRAIGHEIGERFAARLERIGAKQPGQMDARMVYHMAEQVFRDNLDVGRICDRFAVVLDREVGQHHPVKLGLVSALRKVIEGVANERLGLWMMPREIQQWFYEVMHQAEPRVRPRIDYRPSRGDMLEVESTVTVEVVWPRDVLAYNVAMR